MSGPMDTITAEAERIRERLQQASERHKWARAEAKEAAGDRRRTIGDARKAGFTLAEIADELGLTPGRIKQILDGG